MTTTELDLSTVAKLRQYLSQNMPQSMDQQFFGSAVLVHLEQRERLVKRIVDQLNETTKSVVALVDKLMVESEPAKDEGTQASQTAAVDPNAPPPQPGKSITEVVPDDMVVGPNGQLIPKEAVPTMGGFEGAAAATVVGGPNSTGRVLGSIPVAQRAVPVKTAQPAKNGKDAPKGVA